MKTIRENPCSSVAKNSDPEAQRQRDELHGESPLVVAFVWVVIMFLVGLVVVITALEEAVGKVFRDH